MLLGPESSNSSGNMESELTEAGHGLCKVKQGTESHGNVKEVPPLKAFYRYPLEIVELLFYRV